MSDFTNNQVKQVSEFLQNYMRKNNINSMTADQCADLLDQNNILHIIKSKPKTGFHFRQMLRDGRDGLIDLVEGAYQKRPNTRWIIYRKK